MPSINIRVKTIEELADAVQNLMNLQKQFFDTDSIMIHHLSSIETTVQRATGLLRETIYNVGKHKDILQQAAITTYFKGNTHGIFFDLEFEISYFNPRWENFNEVMIEPTKCTLGDIIHNLKAVCRKIIDMNFAMTRIETPKSITNKTESMLKELLEEAVAGAMADLSCLAMNFEENGSVDTEVAEMLLHLDNAKNYLEDIEDIFGQAVVGLEKALNANNGQRSWDVRNDARRVLIDARIGCKNVRGMWKFVHKEMEKGLCGDLKEMSRQFWDTRVGNNEFECSLYYTTMDYENSFFLSKLIDVRYRGNRFRGRGGLIRDDRHSRNARKVARAGGTDRGLLGCRDQAKPEWEQ
ncbi:hypothetical protein EV368DRAFT_66004 [Lentinula lateritia]|nr:hypothetical protein EV368DRAFT_66004 [Lentinula lateritia]